MRYYYDKLRECCRRGSEDKREEQKGVDPQDPDQNSPGSSHDAKNEYESMVQKYEQHEN